MRFTLVVFAVSLLVFTTGCASKYPVPPSTELPAAKGVAKVSKDKNGNSVVDLKVQHFAPPQNLQPSKAVYVVWVETPDGQRYNLGQLRVNEDRQGEISGITPFQTFRLVVTAEDFPNVKQPSSQVVLTTEPLQAK